jgi:hypothetical protein
MRCDSDRFIIFFHFLRILGDSWQNFERFSSFSKSINNSTRSIRTINQGVDLFRFIELSRRAVRAFRSVVDIPGWILVDFSLFWLVLQNLAGVQAFARAKSSRRIRREVLGSRVVCVTTPKMTRPQPTHLTLS